MVKKSACIKFEIMLNSVCTILIKAQPTLRNTASTCLKTFDIVELRHLVCLSRGHNVIFTFPLQVFNQPCLHEQIVLSHAHIRAICADQRQCHPITLLTFINVY